MATIIEILRIWLFLLILWPVKVLDERILCIFVVYQTVNCRKDKHKQPTKTSNISQKRESVEDGAFCLFHIQIHRILYLEARVEVVCSTLLMLLINLEESFLLLSQVIYRNQKVVFAC